MTDEPKHGDFRVVSRLSSLGAKEFFVQRLDVEPVPIGFDILWRKNWERLSQHETLEEACQTKKLLEQQRDYGTVVEDCSQCGDE